jgi:hypothetical protein
MNEWHEKKRAMFERTSYTMAALKIPHANSAVEAFSIQRSKESREDHAHFSWQQG